MIYSCKKTITDKSIIYFGNQNFLVLTHRSNYKLISINHLKAGTNNYEIIYLLITSVCWISFRTVSNRLTIRKEKFVEKIDMYLIKTNWDGDKSLSFDKTAPRYETERWLWPFLEENTCLNKICYKSSTNVWLRREYLNYIRMIVEGYVNGVPSKTLFFKI